MPHIPRFPPVPKDWLPGKPPFEPPLPRFMFNPWLSTAERQTLMAETGEWATARAEAMTPPAAGVEAARAGARHMWETLQRTWGIAAPAAAAPRRRRARAAPAAPAAVTPSLTPAQRAQLVLLVQQAIELKKGTAREGLPPSHMDVKEWAEELGASISLSEAAQIIAEAF